MKIRTIVVCLAWVLLLAGCGRPAASTPDLTQVSDIVAATLTALPSSTGVEASNAAIEASATADLAIAPTGTPSPTATGTPTSTPTETPTISLTPTQASTATLPPEDPRADLGDPTWQAAFKDDGSWFTFEDEQSSIQAVEGVLVMQSFKANDYATWSLTYPKLTDFYLEMTATSGDACQGRDRYGLMARASDPTHGYLFGISCDGYFRVREYDGEKFTEIEPWQYSDYILTGPNQTNRLGFMAQGDELAVYANGHLLAKFSDDSHGRGTFGAFIAAAKTPGFTVKVTRVVYWEIET
jgi:hypothetical protein